MLVECQEEGVGQGGLVITSHVLFAFENDKSIATMGLFLLVWVLIGVGISDDTDLFFFFFLVSVLVN